ncbi:hypothetical protein [Streptomyces sp. VRA16 Mangrove soil]|uniref:hypothetical protein n=1 Tax=Streptomyces sp. VRA16 Mangrove soil TaxID=2817434 RepID=UPI001A9E79FF|nr:hypothetical protein [Streptomyces sp. VRA16 Mangrove soil]MBO1336440.1 hypothetical protein [Streptomyces sp. VRA16 Mangrove soil]
MASMMQSGDDGQNLLVPSPQNHDELIAVAQCRLNQQKAELKRLRHLRRQERLAAVTQLRSRADLFRLGSFAFASAMASYGLGEPAVGLELLKFAFAVWLVALQFPPRA